MNKEDIKILAKYHTENFFDSYKYFGAHIIKHADKQGVSFLVWAPNATAVSLVGTFNFWDDKAHPMERITTTGIWHYFFSNIGENEIYKYKIFTKEGKFIYKADPYAYFSELRPKTSSVIVDLDKYSWDDKYWLEKRNQIKLIESPINIYEIHAGSWKNDGNQNYLNYKELSNELIPYLKDMNYNYIEIMPLMEHPLDGSWGYQITGYYSITSRYGRPEDLMFLIDKCHQNGIGVILDWVPGHFCRDEQGLMNFDGQEIYGKIDHPNWGTKKFDFEKSEVKNFLISNALFYFDKYHIDGLRVDGVTSILQLNFGINGTPYKNRNNGTDDIDGIEFIKELNNAVLKKYPFAIMAAEESTDWPLVTQPVKKGGLGFNFKWNMGWMNDTIFYLENEFNDRGNFHSKITFSMHYAFSENYILPLSHDEVVHGKKNLIEKSPGTYEEKFKNLKLIALYQMSHPGKKLNFMGNEIGQFTEWRYYEEIQWFLLKYPMHDSHKNFIKRLNAIYIKEYSLWYKDDNWDGFRWIDSDNKEQSVFSYIRFNEDDFIIIILNFKNIDYNEFRIGVPENGEYRIILSSDEEIYGGSSKNENKYSRSKSVPIHGMKQSITIKLPGLTGLMIKRKKTRF